MKITTKTINYAVDTIEQLLLADGVDNDTIIVTDENRGGVFVFRYENSQVNNGGTIFNGWTRQYDGSVSVKWFGAKGDGIVDDTNAIQSALDTSLNVLFPTGEFLISSSLFYESGHKILGSGVISKGYYSGTDEYYLAPTNGTNILLSSTAGFDAFVVKDLHTNIANCIAPEIGNMSFSFNGYNNGGTVGNATIYKENANGINITGTKEGFFHTLSGFNIDSIVYAHTVDNTQIQYTARNIISDIIMAHSCNIPIHFKLDTESYTGRYADITIVNINSLINCNYGVLINHCDGAKIENIIVFPGRTGARMKIYDCNWVNIDNTTLFDSYSQNLVINACHYVNANIICGRAGWLSNMQTSGVLIKDSEVISINGIIERPLGQGVLIDNCDDVSINAVIKEPSYLATIAHPSVQAVASSRIAVGGSCQKPTNGDTSVSFADSCLDVTFNGNTDGVVIGTKTINRNKVFVSSVKNALFNISIIPENGFASCEISLNVRETTGNFSVAKKKFIAILRKTVNVISVVSINDIASESFIVSNSNWNMSISLTSTVNSQFGATIEATISSTGGMSWVNAEVFVSAMILSSSKQITLS